MKNTFMAMGRWKSQRILQAWNNLDEKTLEKGIKWLERTKGRDWIKYQIKYPLEYYRAKCWFISS
jgi:hypothetical protein